VGGGITSFSTPLNPPDVFLLKISKVQKIEKQLLKSINGVFYFITTTCSY